MAPKRMRPLLHSRGSLADSAARKQQVGRAFAMGAARAQACAAASRPACSSSRRLSCSTLPTWCLLEIAVPRTLRPCATDLRATVGRSLRSHRSTRVSRSCASPRWQCSPACGGCWAAGRRPGERPSRWWASRSRLPRPPLRAPASWTMRSASLTATVSAVAGLPAASRLPPPPVWWLRCGCALLRARQRGRAHPLPLPLALQTRTRLP